MDVSSPGFVELTRGCLAVAYPSCSEGGGGSIITCMHAGLIPVVTRETSVDIDPSWGIELETSSIDALTAAIRDLAARPAAELRQMSRAAWEYAREHHTRERFGARYRAVMSQLLRSSGRPVREQESAA